MNLSENLRFSDKIKGARITKTADRWFVSIQVDMPEEPMQKRLATLSTGEKYENQAFLKTALKKLRWANKRLHRRVKGSADREKARRQVARLHYRIICLRQDVLEKLTTRLAGSYGMIGVEDLHLKGLLKNRRLAHSFSDTSLGILVRLPETKVTQREVRAAHQGGSLFPSSKTCHWRWDQMTLKDRIFVCQNPS